MFWVLPPRFLGLHILKGYFFKGFRTSNAQCGCSPSCVNSLLSCPNRVDPTFYKGPGLGSQLSGFGERDPT